MVAKPDAKTTTTFTTEVTENTEPEEEFKQRRNGRIFSLLWLFLRPTGAKKRQQPGKTSSLALHSSSRFLGRFNPYL
jgi:hypothetical protein